jgi:hypothetical protein
LGVVLLIIKRKTKQKKAKERAVGITTVNGDAECNGFLRSA